MKMRLIDAEDYLYRERPVGLSDDLFKESHLYKSIMEQEVIQAIPIPEGVINGDMIKAMFPTMEIEECNKDVNGNPNFYRIFGLSGVGEFGREFWNAPYKRGSENGSN